MGPTSVGPTPIVNTQVSQVVQPQLEFKHPCVEVHLGGATSIQPQFYRPPQWLSRRFNLSFIVHKSEGGSTLSWAHQVFQPQLEFKHPCVEVYLGGATSVVDATLAE